MATYTLFGKEYELVCTVDALSKLTAEVNGDVDKIGDRLSTGSLVEQLEAGIEYLGIFIQAGFDRENVKRMLLGQEKLNEHVPTIEELKQAITLDMLEDVMIAITNAINESQKRQVEDKEPKKPIAE